MRIERALVSVSDKSGLETFARGLHELGVELVSTSGTARGAGRGRHARDASVEDLTGAAEMLGGRVKTLHPSIHAGILARRDHAEDMRTLEEQGIKPIDMVVCNLYPFRAVANRREVSEPEVIENIDVGGPTMVRAAAKNFDSVAVVTDPERYGFLLDELQRGRRVVVQRDAPRPGGRGVRAHRRLRRGHRGMVHGHRSLPRPGRARAGARPADLTYGENPHQRAAFYVEAGARRHLLSLDRAAGRQGAVVQQPAAT